MKQATDKPKILITGATGYIGRRLTHRLLQDNRYDIRILVRNRRKVQLGVASKVEIVEGDIFDEDSISSALTGVDTAFYLVHSMGSDKDYSELDRKGAELFRETCIQQGVERVIYLGGLGVKESASKHLLSRIETGEVLSAKPDKLQTIWLRAGVIIGSGSAGFEIIRNLCQKLPVMITPRWVKTKTEAVGIEDVLSYLDQSITLETKESIIVDIGSGVISFQQMMKQAATAMGLKRLFLSVPILSPKLSSYWLILFTPIPYKLASSLVAGLKSETTIQNDNAKKYYPEIEPQPYSQTVAHAVKELENNHIISRWCDSNNTACDINDFDTEASSILRDVRIIPFEHGERQQEVFRAVCSLGGPNGWFRYNILWRIRGLLDKLVGGYGLSRGRRNSNELRVGDALDFWRVADIIENKRVLLYAQMKLPGEAWLEFDIQPDQLVQTAHFIPRGLLGRLYWYSIVPIHNLVFSNLAGTVVKSSSSFSSGLQLSEQS